MVDVDVRLARVARVAAGTDGVAFLHFAARLHLHAPGLQVLDDERGARFGTEHDRVAGWQVRTYSPPGSGIVIVRCIFHDPSGWRCWMRISLPPPENTSPDARARELERTVPH